jgi:hypothetical protein
MLSEMREGGHASRTDLSISIIDEGVTTDAISRNRNESMKKVS